MSKYLMRVLLCCFRVFDSTGAAYFRMASAVKHAVDTSYSFDRVRYCRCDRQHAALLLRRGYATVRFTVAGNHPPPEPQPGGSYVCRSSPSSLVSTLGPGDRSVGGSHDAHPDGSPPMGRPARRPGHGKMTST